MNLAQKFGYTEQEFAKIKKFAEKQVEDLVEGSYDMNKLVFIELEETGEWILSPWFDGVVDLTDEEAVKVYGEKFVQTWCKLAHEFLSEA